MARRENQKTSPGDNNQPTYNTAAGVPCRAGWLLSRKELQKV
jgi:hypothetical protein